MSRHKRVSPRRKRGFWHRLRRSLAWIAGLWLLSSVGVVVLLRFLPPPTSAFMLERQAHAWMHDEQDFQLHYQWVSWQHMGAWVPLAVVAAEDQKFPFHHGFDVASIRKALVEAGEGERLRGASTISQQTAKNLFLWGGRSFVRKGLEAYFTVLIELLWPKQRILEVYANIAEFDDGVYGVRAAAQNIFQTTPERVSPAQAALLAAVLPNPKRLHAARPSAYVQRRANWIRRQMRQLGGPGYVRFEPAPPP